MKLAAKLENYWLRLGMGQIRQVRIAKLAARRL
jgi:hypothetical protein